MVITSLSPLSVECNSWRNVLRAYKEQLQARKEQLPNLAIRHRQKEDLLQIDHFDNQFYIQLINIHDLKQSIKQHEKQLLSEVSEDPSNDSESLLADHAQLLDDYQMLHHRLDELIGEFEHFAQA